MKKSVLFLLVCLACTPESQPVNQSAISWEGEEILVGEINLEGLAQAPYEDWYSSFYNDYNIDMAALEGLDDRFYDVDMLVFLGTWCSDSQMQIPQFVRIIRYLGYDLDRMTMIALERDENRVMSSPQRQEEGLDITHVPTFIFYEDGKELGRIIEFPEVSLEADLVRIINQ